MPVSDFKLGGIQKIVAGSARSGLIFRRDLLFLGVNPAKTPVRQSPDDYFSRNLNDISVEENGSFIEKS